MPDEPVTPSSDDELNEATLVFREQADGRKVSRLPGGKVVLINYSEIDRVKSGERWHVHLKHRDTFAIAELLDRERPDLINPVLAAGIAAHIRTVAPGVQTGAPNGAAPATAAVRALTPAPAPRVVPSLRERTPITPSKVVGLADRVAFFIDGANMDRACRSAGYFVDYRKAREFFLANGIFNAAYYYIADYTAQDPLQQRYLDFLAHAGYIVRRKAVKAIRDSETGERILKANVDIELVLDLVNTAENYDLAFLFSGDSDFERAVELLRSRGKRVYVVSAKAVLSRELSYVADKPIFLLEEFKAALERDERRPEH